FRYIIEPAASECGYDEVIRADQISDPGVITHQIVQHLIEDSLVVADLTGQNLNVFYELAIRHATRKPTVQIIALEEPIPFDVATVRTIQVDHKDLDSVANCIESLKRQIRSAEENPSNVDSPLSAAINLQARNESKDPLAEGVNQI